MDALFLEKLLLLLSQSSFTTTYKYAVLLTLIDLCVEGELGGAAPSSLTVDQVAAHLVALYWRHADPANQAMLQSFTRHGGQRSQAGMLRIIADLRELAAPADRFPEQVLRSHPAQYRRAIARVGWIAMEKPLPRLQVIGQRDDPFLFRIDWTVRQDDGRPIQPDAAVLSRAALLSGEITPVLLFLHGVADQLVALAPVLRPLIHRHWASMVANINGYTSENQVEEALFGHPSREAMSPIREPLWELQGRRCFFCDEPMSLRRTQVDHVLPWSRCPDDSLENLVAADEPCNRDKRDLLVSAPLVRRWTERPEGALARIADRAQWPYSRERTRRAGAVLYRHLSPGTPVWSGVKRLDTLTEADRASILGALMG